MNKTAATLIFVTIFIDLLGFGIIIPILPFYAEYYGATAFHVGLLGTVYSLMQFVFAPIWGRVSDQRGRKPLLVLSLFGTAIGHFIFALAPNLTWLFIGRIFAGIATATIPVAFAYISDITSKENRAKGMGMVGAAFGLGFILGPAIGGLLSAYGYATPLLSASGFSLVAALIALFKLPESLPPEKRGKKQARTFNIMNLIDAMRHPNIGILFTIFFFITLAFSNLETVFALFSERRLGFDSTDNGYVFTMIGVISALTQGVFIGPLVKKFGEIKLINFAIFFLGVSFMLYPFTSTVLQYLPVVALTAFTLGLNNPTIISLISKNTEPEQQGGIMGIHQSLGSLGRVLGPIWGGYVFDEVGIGFPFSSAGILILLMFFVSLRLYKKNLLQTT